VVYVCDLRSAVWMAIGMPIYQYRVRVESSPSLLVDRFNHASLLCSVCRVAKLIYKRKRTRSVLQTRNVGGVKSVAISEELESHRLEEVDNLS